MEEVDVGAVRASAVDARTVVGPPAPHDREGGPDVFVRELPRSQVPRNATHLPRVDLAQCYSRATLLQDMFPVLLPTETINRDLDGQLLLGAHLAKRGARVFIGLDLAIRTAAKYLKGGVLVGKAVEPFFPTAAQPLYEALKESDFTCVHLDDEGAIFPGVEADWRATLLRRLDVSRVAAEDVVAVWGRYQEGVYASQHGAQSIRVTGHPRFDLYNKELSVYHAPVAKTLAKRFGDFVLINTNLSRANNGLGIATTFTKRWHYDPDRPDVRREAIGFWGHTSRILVALVELVHSLSDRFPKLRLILRPHPSESFEFYRIVTSGLPNVTVIHEGSVGPWMLASKAVIHDGCTTGIEAWLAGVPVINYKAFADERYDLLVPNQFGTRCTTEPEVVEAIEGFLAGKPTSPTEAPPIAKDLLANFESDSMPMMLEAIELARPRVGSSSYRFSSHRVHARLEEGMEALRAQYRTASPARRQASVYARQKFYGFDKEDIADRMRRLENATALKVRHEVMSRQMICLSAGA